MSGSSGLGLWASARLPASWRGLVFRVRESEIKRGRRTALHEYPFRDDVWVEDLGRATRITAFRGYVAGDDVDDQVKAMVDAAEQAGDGTLVHPALGSMTASLIEFTARDADGQGRVWSLEFVFVSGSARTFPATDVATQGAVGSAADNCTATVAGSYADSIGATLGGAYAAARSGLADAQQVVRGVQSTVGGAVAEARGLVSNVRSLSSVAGLAGNFGRFSLGARLSTIPGLGTVNQVLASSNAAAASVSRIGGTVSRLAALL